MHNHSITAQPISPIPADDLNRSLTLARPEQDQALPHFGIMGGTYTPLLSGKDTDGRYCLVDMLVPPGGGPGAHRHDFEESFTVLAGEIEITFRGARSTLRAGETAHIPANAPHEFQNRGQQAARLLCICAPAGQEEFFARLGEPLATRTTTPAQLDAPAMQAFLDKAKSLSPRYRTELIPPAH